jgi:type IV pilus assembly protein PilV
MSGIAMKKRIMDNDGFTMVEVLVALLILAIGLLSFAGLQIRSLTGSHSAYVRTQAAQYAADIVDRMMANRGAATVGNYDIALGTAPCNAANVACDDLTEWKQSLNGTINATGGLPGGDGSIAVGAGNVATVVVQWTDTSGTSALQVQARIQ